MVCSGDVSPSAVVGGHGGVTLDLLQPVDFINGIDSCLAAVDTLERSIYCTKAPSFRIIQARASLERLSYV